VLKFATADKLYIVLQDKNIFPVFCWDTCFFSDSCKYTFFY